MAYGMLRIGFVRRFFKESRAWRYAYLVNREPGPVAERAYQFGDWLIEPALNRGRNGDSEVELEPITMNVLTFMLEHPGETLSIDQFLANVWEGRVVEPNAVHRNITMIRRALGDTTQDPRYVANIRKRGYRTVAPVTQVGQSAGAVAPERVAEHLPMRRWLYLAFLLTTTAIAGVVWLTRQQLIAVDKATAISERPLTAIAVLPFEDISPGGDQAYLGNGIADELRLELQHLDGLRVAGRTSSNAYAQEGIKTIGETLNVGSILEGSVRKDGDDVRITVQLASVADGFTLWSHSYHRKLEKIFEMQEEIATSVAGALGVRLGVGGVNAFRGAGTRNIEAYEAYLQAESKDWTVSGLDAAIPLLERAVELDPDYAVAWSMLAARTLGGIWDVDGDEAAEVVERAHELARRGMQLNPESASAHSTLALIRRYQFDWIGSEQSHARAIALLTDRPALEEYARMLMRTGRMAYAQQQFDAAVIQEPFEGRPPNLAWHVSLAQGRIEETREIIRNSHDKLNATENSLDLSFSEQDPEALKAAIRAMPEVDDAYLNLPYTHLYSAVLAEFDSPDQVLSTLQAVYRDDSLQWPRKLHDIAMLAAYFGDPQFALKVKREEIHTNPVRLAAVWYPVMSEVRQLPGFKSLVAELNLVAYWRAYGWADACRPVNENEFECS